MMMGRRRWRNKSEDLPQFFNLRISGKDFRRTVFFNAIGFSFGQVPFVYPYVFVAGILY